MCDGRLLIAVMAIEQQHSKYAIKIDERLKIFNLINPENVLILLISINNSINVHITLKIFTEGSWTGGTWVL